MNEILSFLQIKNLLITHQGLIAKSSFVAEVIFISGIIDY